MSDEEVTLHHRAAIIIQSYIRMVAAQHQVLYALYQQSQLSLEQSFLNMMIHHDQDEYKYQQSHDCHKEEIINRHHATAQNRTIESVRNSHTHFVVDKKEESININPKDHIDHVIELFQNCLHHILGGKKNYTIKHLFSRADLNGDGFITRKEFHLFFSDALDFCMTEFEFNGKEHTIVIER
jgi:hypothetical protein